MYVSAETPDKKMGKLLMEILNFIPLIYIGGRRIILFDIVKNQWPKGISNWISAMEESTDFGLILRNYLIHLNEMLSRDLLVIKDTLSCWVVSFHSSIHPSSEIQSDEWLRLLLKQILQGVVLADRLHILVISILDLHAFLEVPLRKEKVKSLCHMIISLKVIGETFQTKGVSIVQSLPHIINIIQADIEQFIIPFKTKLQSELAKGNQATKLGFLSSLTRGGKEMDTKLADSFSLVLIFLQLLGGGGSFKRQLIFSITMDVFQSIGNLDIDFQKMKKLMSKLAIVSNFQSIVSERVDCSFLYWRREMLSTCLSMVYGDQGKLTWIQYILDAFSDGLWLLKLGNLSKFPIQNYEEEIENSLRNEIIAPLCRDIEADLRLHVHSTHLKGSVFVNPTKTGVRNLSWYLKINPLKLPFKFVDLKLIVESYLIFAFYGYSVISNYDQKIYSEMRHLGELKYGLELNDFHIAEFSTGQGLDLSKYVQNLDLFSKNYSYNIIKQIFLENDLDGQDRKNLRVINAEHVIHYTSLYGLKSLSATSNSVLEFINKRLAEIHELLQDDSQIDLLKEPNLSEINIRQGDLQFALMSLNLNIGDNKSLSLLEQLQSIITRIGNILGLVRIILSGCSRYSSDTSWYTRDSFHTIKPLPFFVEVFSQKLRCSEFGKFKDFYMVVPSVMYKMVERRVTSKDKLLKRDRQLFNSLISLDGFIMGLSFILKVLGQEKSFDELDWFSFAKKKMEGIPLPQEGSRVLENKKGGSTLSSLKLWRQSPVPTSDGNKGPDKRGRCINELELLECNLKIARTIMS